jgi:hypothetical protein
VNVLACVNFLTAVFAVTSVYLVVRLYGLLRTPSILVMLAAVSSLAFVRITVAFAQTYYPGSWLTLNTTYLLVPFWPLLALALWMLLRSLERIMKD